MVIAHYPKKRICAHSAPQPAGSLRLSRVNTLREWTWDFLVRQVFCSLLVNGHLVQFCTKKKFASKWSYPAIIYHIKTQVIKFKHALFYGNCLPFTKIKQYAFEKKLEYRNQLKKKTFSFFVLSSLFWKFIDSVDHTFTSFVFHK